MRLNINVIFDEIKDLNGSIVSSSDDYDMNLLGCRLLSGQVKEIAADLLYFGPNSVLEKYYKNNNNLNFISIGGANKYTEDVCIQNNHRAIFLPEDCSIEVLNERINSIFEKYNRWEEGVLNSIRQNAPIQDILILCGNILKNPLAMFDNSLSMICWTGNLPNDLGKRSIWNNVLNTEFSPNYIQDNERRSVAKGFEERIFPIIIHSQQYHEDHFLCGLYLDEEIIGSLGCVFFTPSTIGEISILKYIKTLLEWSISNTFKRREYPGEMPHTLYDLLKGMIVRKRAIDALLSRWHWSPTDIYQLFVFQNISDGIIRKDECPMFSVYLEKFFSSSIFYPFDGNLIAITHFNQSEFNKQEFESTQLKETLEKLNLRLAISMQFGDMMYLYNAYNQCELALLHGTENIVSFLSCYSKSITHSLTKLEKMESFCSPQILQYWKNGGEKERDFIRCLHVYLQNGRSLTKAARKLFIHRNTLLYRINQMSELIGYDLSSDYLDDEILLMLNFSCMIVESLSL